MAAFGINAIHPTNTRTHKFGFASAKTSGVHSEWWQGPDNSTAIFNVYADGDIIPGPQTAAALATTAVAGFMYVRSCNGAATGTPTQAGTGRVPLVYDYANHALYAYHGSWRSVTLS